MHKTYNSLEGKIQQLGITRSRLHYKPISRLELTLITALSVFVGVGVSIVAAIGVPQNNLDSQVQSGTTEQYTNLFNSDSAIEILA